MASFYLITATARTISSSISSTILSSFFQLRINSLFKLVCFEAVYSGPCHILGLFTSYSIQGKSTCCALNKSNKELRQHPSPSVDGFIQQRQQACSASASGVREQRLLDCSAAQCRCSKWSIELAALCVGLCVCVRVHAEDYKPEWDWAKSRQRQRESVLRYAVLCVSSDQRQTRATWAPNLEHISARNNVTSFWHAHTHSGIETGPHSTNP